MTDIFNAAATAVQAAVSGVAGFGPIIGDSAAPYAMISSPNRNIGGIMPDVVVEEVHHDELMITQHPVEIGAPSADHAFMQPVGVEIHAMWSDSSAQSEGYVQQVYDQLQALQQSAQPFSVTTGKRGYSKMLIRSLVVLTDVAREFALDVRAFCQNIIITNSGSGGGSATGDSMPTDGQQTVASVNPDINGNTYFNTSTISGGLVQMLPAPSSAPTVASVTGG